MRESWRPGNCLMVGKEKNPAFAMVKGGISPWVLTR